MLHLHKEGRSTYRHSLSVYRFDFAYVPDMTESSNQDLSLSSQIRDADATKGMPPQLGSLFGGKEWVSFFKCHLLRLRSN